jgi:hypothetical protein
LREIELKYKQQQQQQQQSQVSVATTPSPSASESETHQSVDMFHSPEHSATTTPVNDSIPSIKLDSATASSEQPKLDMSVVSQLLDVLSSITPESVTASQSSSTSSALPPVPLPLPVPIPPPLPNYAGTDASASASSMSQFMIDGGSASSGVTRKRIGVDDVTAAPAGYPPLHPADDTAADVIKRARPLGATDVHHHHRVGSFGSREPTPPLVHAHHHLPPPVSLAPAPAYDYSPPPGLSSEEAPIWRDLVEGVHSRLELYPLLQDVRMRYSCSQVFNFQHRIEFKNFLLRMC